MVRGLEGLSLVGSNADLSGGQMLYTLANTNPGTKKIRSVTKF